MEKRRTRLTGLALMIALLTGLLAGCGQQSGGMELSVCVGNSYSTLDPIYAEDISSQTVLVHLYENLMRVTEDGDGNTTVVNGMAKSVETEENTDGTVTYTFQLRSADWSDGQRVQAEDFVYAWRRLADPSSHSPYASLLSVVCGYQEAREAGDMSLLQVSAESDTVFQVTLTGKYDWFLREVCTSPATIPLREDVVQRLKEAQNTGEDGTAASWWSDPLALVTNGPYQAEEYAEGSYLQLTAREDNGRSGPYRLIFQFAASAGEAQELYNQDLVDAVWPLTEERLQELSQDEDWSPIPQLATYSVVYNCDSEGALADTAIRRALTLAVDRNALAELAGVTAQAAEGFIPPGVPGDEEADFRTSGGALLENDPESYAERCAQARSILSDAGYSGDGLGELEYLYVEDGATGAVAQELCRQWREVLDVDVTPRAVTSQELWSALRGGEYTLAGVNLEAPGNDAECFLMDWISDSYDNVANYENSAYDTLMSIIARASDGTARMGCLHDAEALLLEDQVLNPLYTEGTAWELRDNLTGACRDARGWFDFSNVTVKTA